MKFPAYCLFKPTGKLIVCQDGQSFYDATMVYKFPVGGVPDGSAPIVEVERVEDVHVGTSDEARFADLHGQRAWLVSKPAEIRAEYQALKIKLNK